MDKYFKNEYLYNLELNKIKLNQKVTEFENTFNAINLNIIHLLPMFNNDIFLVQKLYLDFKKYIIDKYEENQVISFLNIQKYDNDFFNYYFNEFDETDIQLYELIQNIHGLYWYKNKCHDILRLITFIECNLSNDCQEDGKNET